VNEKGAVAKIPPKTVVDIYVTRSGKRVAAFDGDLWSLVETEKRQTEAMPKRLGRPKYVAGPHHPWRKFVIKNK